MLAPSPPRPSRVTPARAALALLAIGGATILAALAFQYVGGYRPCALCLAQRTPYYAGLPMAAAATLAALIGRPLVARVLLGLVLLVFLYGAGLGVYQAGAEWGFWPGPSDCGATGAALPTRAGDLLKSIETAKVVSCTEVQWRFLGLSFAGWSAAVSALLAAIAAAGALARPA